MAHFGQAFEGETESGGEMARVALSEHGKMFQGAEIPELRRITPARSRISVSGRDDQEGVRLQVLRELLQEHHRLPQVFEDIHQDDCIKF